MNIIIFIMSNIIETSLILSTQIILIVLYGLFTKYDVEVSASSSVTTNSLSKDTVLTYYPFFQDVHVMIFVGFGFLMTFLRKHCYTSVGMNFLIGAFVLQASILINGFFHCLFNNSWHKITLDIKTLITGDFAAGAVLITMGAVLGRINFKQMYLTAILELLFYAVNENIYVSKLEAIDMGGSMVVHSFGAFFGLALSWMLYRESSKNHKDNKSVYHSDMFAFIGCIFLWMYWPSFNGALATGNSKHRVVINTVLSLTGSCISTFALSQLLRGGKLEMEDILNASLAGGVAVGSSSDLVISPWGALLTGCIAGIVSCIGYNVIQKYLEDNCNLLDTCGVNNLHGMPGIIGGLGGVISSLTASDSVYGDSIDLIFPARAGSDGRSAKEQALYQFLGIVITLGISIIGGIITGFFVNLLKNDDSVEFDDSEYWYLPEEEIPFYHSKNTDSEKNVVTNMDHTL